MLSVAPSEVVYCIVAIPDELVVALPMATLSVVSEKVIVWFGEPKLAVRVADEPAATLVGLTVNELIWLRLVVSDTAAQTEPPLLSLQLPAPVMVNTAVC